MALYPSAAMYSGESFVFFADRLLCDGCSADQMLCDDLLYVLGLDLDVSGQLAIIFVNVNDRLQVACTYAAGYADFDSQVFLCDLLFEFSSGLLSSGRNAAAALSYDYSHAVTSAFPLISSRISLTLSFVRLP